MADPLSITASIVGITAAGVQVSISLFALAETVSTASERVSSVANDISSTCGILCVHFRISLLCVVMLITVQKSTARSHNAATRVHQHTQHFHFQSDSAFRYSFSSTSLPIDLQSDQKIP